MIRTYLWFNESKYAHEKTPENSPDTIKILLFVSKNLIGIMINLMTLNYKSEVNIGEKETVNN